MTQVNQTIFMKLQPFIQKEGNKIIQEILSDKVYEPSQSREIIENICKQILTKLTQTNKNFKYITNCILTPKKGSGLDTAGAQYWDQNMDGLITIKWDSLQIVCILNVYGIAI